MNFFWIGELFKRTPAIILLMNVIIISYSLLSAAQKEDIGQWRHFQYVEANKPLFPPRAFPRDINDLYDYLMEEAETDDGESSDNRQRRRPQHRSSHPQPNRNS